MAEGSKNDRKHRADRTEAAHKDLKLFGISD